MERLLGRFNRFEAHTGLSAEEWADREGDWSGGFVGERGSGSVRGRNALRERTVRSTCEATTVDPSRGLQLVGGAVEQGPHPPTPRAMAATPVQISRTWVKTPGARDVRSVHRSLWGNRTGPRVALHLRNLGLLPHPRQRGGAVQSCLGCTRTKTLGGIPRTAATGVRTDGDPRESTGTTRRSCCGGCSWLLAVFVPAVGPGADWVQ